MNKKLFIEQYVYFILATISFLQIALMISACGGEIDLSESRLSCKNSDCPDGFTCNDEKYCIPDDEVGNNDAGEGEKEGDSCGKNVDLSVACGEYLACVACCDPNDNDIVCEQKCEVLFSAQNSECYNCRNEIHACDQQTGCALHQDDVAQLYCSWYYCRNETKKCYNGSQMLILAGVTEELKCRDDETCIRSEAVLAAMCVNMNKVNGESINPWSDDGERGGACVSGTTKCKDNSFCMSDNSADGTGVCLALCSVDIAVNNCTQQCTSKECGPDGCGGSCGRCDAGKICSQEGKCQ